MSGILGASRGLRSLFARPSTTNLASLQRTPSLPSNCENVGTNSETNSLFTQVRHRCRLSHSLLQQYYKKIPIRKKWIKAIKQGRMQYENGQVKFPPLVEEKFLRPKGAKIFRVNREMREKNRVYNHILDDF